MKTATDVPRQTDTGAEKGEPIGWREGGGGGATTAAGAHVRNAHTIRYLFVNASISPPNNMKSNAPHHRPYPPLSPPQHCKRPIAWCEAAVTTRVTQIRRLRHPSRTSAPNPTERLALQVASQPHPQHSGLHVLHLPSQGPQSLHTPVACWRAGCNVFESLRHSPHHMDGTSVFTVAGCSDARTSRS